MDNLPQRQVTVQPICTGAAVIIVVGRQVI